jgi:hypothetical protein
MLFQITHTHIHTHSSFRRMLSIKNSIYLAFPSSLLSQFVQTVIINNLIMVERKCSSISSTFLLPLSFLVITFAFFLTPHSISRRLLSANYEIMCHLRSSNLSKQTLIREAFAEEKWEIIFF